MSPTGEAPYDYDQIWTEVYGDMQRVGPVHRHLKRLLSEVLATLDYDSVLDVGCGPGGNLPLLCRGRRLDKVAGVDISPWAVEQARRNLPGEFHVLDVEKERLEGRFDLVHGSLILEHLADDRAALRHLRAMTGKYLLATTIAGDFERYRRWDERVGHVRNYAVGELEQKLVEAGFTVCRSIYWGFPFYSPVVRTLQNRSGAAAGEFNLLTRLVAEVLYYLYFLNSRRKGDLLVVLAKT
jgi:SAM-dependent methyltransferase